MNMVAMLFNKILFLNVSEIFIAFFKIRRCIIEHCYFNEDINSIIKGCNFKKTVGMI